MQTLDLQAYSYEDRQGLVPAVIHAFTHSGGWVLERNTTSTTTIEFRLEIQLRRIVDLYAALVEAGIELTRVAHATLTDLCTCLQNIACSPQPNRVLSLRLELSFLEDVTLHSLFATSCSLA